MPRRRPKEHGFNLATVVQIGIIPIATVGIYYIGNYFLTGDTLARHTQEIAKITQNAEKFQNKETEARQKLRDEYLANQSRTNEILGKLDTRLAVSETKQETANQTLRIIADQLGRITSVHGN
jgi:N-acyl-D-aspartate/D-glutamate deacylase